MCKVIHYATGIVTYDNGDIIATTLCGANIVNRDEVTTNQSGDANCPDCMRAAFGKIMDNRRDTFAAAALTVAGTIEDISRYDECNRAGAVAFWAREIADALIAELDKYGEIDSDEC